MNKSVFICWASLVCGCIPVYGQLSKEEEKKLSAWSKEDKKADRLFRYSVFFDLMGDSEENFVKHAGSYGGITSLDLSTYKPKRGFYKDLVDSKKSPFTLETIGELKKQFKKYKDQHKAAVKPGSITILDGFDIWNKQGLMDALRETDIRYLQEMHPGAVFQLASNFNSLEGGVGTGTLSHMIKSPVQGENAVLGTLGGGVIRKYLIPHDARNLLKHTNAQVSDNGHIKNTINFTDKDIDSIAVGYHAHVAVTSGYYPPFVRTDKDTLVGSGGLDIKGDYVDAKEQGVDASNKTYYDKLRDRIDVLFKNQLVNYSRNPVFIFNKRLDLNKPVYVDQVITSAYNICKKTNADKSAKVILKAMYIGTILAAAVNHTDATKPPHVFLTLVGAGAFCNEISWVMEALNQDIVKEVIAYTGMQVTLVVYPDIRKGRGLNDKSYDSKGTSQEQKSGSAIPGIYTVVKSMNQDIQKIAKTFEQISDVPDSGALLRLGSALQTLAA